MAFIKKNLVAIIIFTVAAALLYYFYSSSGSSTELLTNTSATQSPISQEVLTTLGNLRTIKLDSSIFNDPLFASLSDFGVTIPPAAAGRRNPFAPVGQGGASVAPPAGTAATTTKAATTTPPSH